MRALALLLIASAGAALAPLLPSRAGGKADASAFPGWPAAFEGRALVPVALSDVEERFQRDGLVGRMARFRDDAGRIIGMRWVAEATRHLHPVEACYRAAGHRVEPLGLDADAQGILWRRFRVGTCAESFIVAERFYDEAGGNWTDVSSWWWDAVLGKSSGPWWAVTVTTPERPGER